MVFDIHHSADRLRKMRKYWAFDLSHAIVPQQCYMSSVCAVLSPTVGGFAWISVPAIRFCDRQIVNVRVLGMASKTASSHSFFHPIPLSYSIYHTPFSIHLPQVWSTSSQEHIICNVMLVFQLCFLPLCALCARVFFLFFFFICLLFSCIVSLWNPPPVGTIHICGGQQEEWLCGCAR